MSATHVLIAVVVILAFVFNLLVLQDRSSTTLIALAARPLAAGSVLDASAVELVPMSSDFEGIDQLITEDDLAGREGWVVTRTISEGAPVDRDALVEAGASSGLRSMSLPVAVEHAAGGGLAPGDTVDVISVSDGHAEFVAVGLEVLAVSEATTGGIGAGGSYHLVVAVGPGQALALASALDSGSMEVIRSTGAAVIDEGAGD